MTPLINAADIRSVRDLSNQIKDSKINPIISDAEISDLRPLLGDALFYAIKKTPSDYTNLLDPLEYVLNDKTYYHFGVKRLLIELAYARYMFDNGDVSTPFGIVDKNFQEGNKSSRERVKELSNLRKKTANDYWLSIERYLVYNRDLYPLYEFNGEKIDTYKFSNITR